METESRITEKKISGKKSVDKNIDKWFSFFIIFPLFLIFSFYILLVSGASYDELSPLAPFLIFHGTWTAFHKRVVGGKKTIE